MLIKIADNGERFRLGVRDETDKTIVDPGKCLACREKVEDQAILRVFLLDQFAHSRGDMSDYENSDTLIPQLLELAGDG